MFYNPVANILIMGDFSLFIAQPPDFWVAQVFSLILISFPSFPCHGIFLHPVAQVLAVNSILPCPWRSCIACRNKAGFFSFLFFIPAFSCNCLALDKGHNTSGRCLSVLPIYVQSFLGYCHVFGAKPTHYDESSSVLCHAPSPWCGHLVKASQGRNGSGCKTHPVAGASQDFNLSYSSHEAISGSLKVWLVSLYILLHHFYSSSHCSAKNKSVKSFFLSQKSFWNLAHLDFSSILSFLNFFKFIILYFIQLILIVGSRSKNLFLLIGSGNLFSNSFYNSFLFTFHFIFVFLL